MYTTREPESVSSHLVAVITAETHVLFHFAKCFVTKYRAVMQRLHTVLSSHRTKPGCAAIRELKPKLRRVCLVHAGDVFPSLFLWSIFFFPLADRRLVHFPFLPTELFIQNVPPVSSCLPGSSSSNNSSSVLTCNQSN